MNAQNRLPAELFKLAIDLGRYYYWSGMCIALGELEVEGAITRTERVLAAEEIARYMDRLKEGASKPTSIIYLREALKYCGLPYDEEATTAIYLDWDNRPYKDDN